jgi:CheY-like chemotaxis protein
VHAGKVSERHGSLGGKSRGLCLGDRLAAESAEKAKRILETIRPHVLVTDIAMPDDGLELIREVKAVAETKGIHMPAIAITAYRDRREELLAEGFAELLEKPLDPITLCGVVLRHVQL